MKIALVSDSYFNLYSSISSHIAVLYNGLTKLGHEVKVFTSDVNIKKTEIEAEFVSLPAVPSYSCVGQGVKVTSLLSVSSLLEDFEPDIIHTFTFTMLSYMAVSYAIKNDIPAVCTAFDLRDIIEDKNNSSFIKAVNNIRYNFIAKKILQNCDKVLCFEENGFKALSEYCEEEKIQVISLLADSDIYNRKKVDSLKLRDFKESYEIGFNKTSVLFAGDLSNPVTLGNLLDSWSGCVTPSDRLSLVIAGEGIEKEELLEICKIHGISSQVIYIENLPHEQMPLCYSSCDAFIVPTDKKSVYIEPLEAISCGTPVIVYKDSPMVNLFDKKKNAFVYSNNSELKKVLTGFNSLDNEQKKLIRNVVASTSVNNAAQKQAENIESVYESLF